MSQEESASRVAHPELDALEASLDPVIVGKLSPIFFSDDPGQYEVALRLFSQEDLRAVSKPLLYSLADEVAAVKDINDIVPVVASLLDEKILNSPHLAAVNDSGATCVIGLLNYGYSAAEVSDTLAFIVSLDFHYVDRNLLRPVSGILGDPPHIDNYKKYLAAITDEKIARIVDTKYADLYTLSSQMRIALQRSLLVDPNPDAFEHKLQILVQAEAQLFILYSLSAEKTAVANMVTRGDSAVDIQTTINYFSDVKYLQQSSWYRPSVRHILTTAGVQEVRFIADTLPNSRFPELPEDVQRAIIIQYDQSRSEEKITRLIDLYLQDEFKKIWDDSPFAFASIIRSCGLLEKPELFLNAIELLHYVYTLNSSDMDIMQPELIPQLLQLPLEEAYRAIDTISEIFRGNNLPLFAKQFKIFETLYFSSGSKFRDTRFFRELAEKGGKSNLSPLLSSLAARVERYSESNSQSLSTTELIKTVFWQDLLHIAIDSADPSLYAFLSNLEADQILLDRAKTADFQQLKQSEVIQLELFFDRLDIIVRDFSARKADAGKEMTASNNAASLSERYLALQAAMGVTDEGKFTDRIMSLYLGPSGYADIGEILQRMDEVKSAAHTRNIENERIEEDSFIFHEGDLIKAVKLEFTHHVLLGGFRSGEFLGSVGLSASSDLTPFDADFWRLQHCDVSDGSGMGIVEIFNTASRGEISFIIKNRGQFSGAIGADTANQEGRDTSQQHKYELIHSARLGIRHYGVRTGIPSTEIDAIILNTSVSEDVLSKLRFQIANNGFYIPICDRTGTVLYTPEDFDNNKISRSAVEDSLTSESFSSEQLLDALETAPFLKEIFALHSGVGEGYSLREHTMMVMQQFEKYYAGSYDSSVLSLDHMRVLLALHDSGKSLAVAEHRKEDQHEFTRELMQFALPACGLSPQQAERVIVLMDQDILGEYFKGMVDLDRSAKAVIALARTLKIQPIEMIDLLRMLYISDAGSYTADASGDPHKNNLGHIFQFSNSDAVHAADFSDTYRESFNELKSTILTSSGETASSRSKHREQETRVCQNCHKAHPSSANYCSECGSRL